MSSTTILQPTLPENRPTRPRPYAADRHRPEDTFLIGGKPHDPADPGPWLWQADPAYRPDRRTGRHRRGELPDPAPAPVPVPSPILEGPQRLPKLREDALARFLVKSEDFALAHTTPPGPGPMKTLLNAWRRWTRVAGGRPSPGYAGS